MPPGGAVVNWLASNCPALEPIRLIEVHMINPRQLGFALVTLLPLATACTEPATTAAPDEAGQLHVPTARTPTGDTRLIAAGREIFRFDDFGDSRF